MKKKTFALILSAILALTMFPVTASAANDNSIHVSSYDELQTAINSLEGGTATFALDKDITLASANVETATSGEDIYFMYPGNFTINLNGHTISKKNPEDAYYGVEPIINISSISDEQASVTITGNGKIGFTNEVHEGVAFYNEGSLTIENGTFIAPHTISNEGYLTIKDGNFTGYNVISNSGKLTIDNGHFTSIYMKDYTDPSKQTHQPGWHTCLWDNTEWSSTDGIENCGSTINGGVFESIGSEIGTMRFGRITVNGGSFNGLAAVQPAIVQDNVLLAITGGDFTRCDDFFANDSNEYAFTEEQLVVTGGKFIKKQLNAIKMALIRGGSESPDIDPVKANPITVKAKTVTIKANNLKKKAQTINAAKAFTVTKAKGTVTYQKLNGNKKITVAKAGKVTVKKGLKKGTYKITVKVSASGDKTYASGSKTVTLKIKVK